MESENQSEFYIVRTSPGKEEKFIEAATKVINRKEDTGIYAIFRPELVKGYIFVEGESLTKIVDLFRNVPNNKGVIRKAVNFEELEKYFNKEAQQVLVNERDIVEIIAGPFKGDRAKVVRIVPGKDEAIIEPINMAVPIPITLNLDDIRVIEAVEDKNE